MLVVGVKENETNALLELVYTADVNGSMLTSCGVRGTLQLHGLICVLSLFELIQHNRRNNLKPASYNLHLSLSSKQPNKILSPALIMFPVDTALYLSHLQYMKPFVLCSKSIDTGELTCPLRCWITFMFCFCFIFGAKKYSLHYFHLVWQ